MTRPRKQTVDYFPHVCKHGKTMFILEQRYGNNGYAFWFKLLEFIGSSEGHFIDCNDLSTWEYLQSITRMDSVVCNEILSLLSNLHAIDPDLWESRVIWSDNFVAGIVDAYRNRVLDIPKRPDFLRQKPAEVIQSDVQNPQTKLEKTKVNKTREKIIASPESPDGDNGDALPSFVCSSFEIHREYYDKILAEYPGLTPNILNMELSKMADWLSDNPTKNKRTAKGHIKNPKLFIRNWIERMEIKHSGGKAWYE